jgi:cystathionine beta-lyase/cystathionine gamma-synthase
LGQKTKVQKSCFILPSKRRHFYRTKFSNAGGNQEFALSLQTTTLYSLDPLERKLGGMKDNLLRYSLGIEDADDLIADLEQALAKI